MFLTFIECLDTCRLSWYLQIAFILTDCLDTNWLSWYLLSVLILTDCFDTYRLPWYLHIALILTVFLYTYRLFWYLQIALMSMRGTRLLVSSPSSLDNPLSPSRCSATTGGRSSRGGSMEEYRSPLPSGEVLNCSPYLAFWNLDKQACGCV